MRYLPAITVLTALLSVSNTSVAQESMNLALDLGDVIASEEFCGLEYNQDAISAFITKHVPADDMKFAPMLESMIEGSKGQFSEMSPTAKTAHCAQTVRVARSYGFLK